MKLLNLLTTLSSLSLMEKRSEEVSPKYRVVRRFTDDLEDRLYSPGNWVCISKYYYKSEIWETPMKPPQPMYNAILNYVGGENEEGVFVNVTQPVNVENFLRHSPFQIKLCLYQDPAHRVKPLSAKVYEEYREETRVLVWKLPQCMGEMNENWDDWLTKAKKRFADLKGFHANCTINYTYINQFLSDPKDAESCLRHEFGAVIMDKGIHTCPYASRA